MTTLAERVAARLRGTDEVLVGQMDADEETLLGCPLFGAVADLVESGAAFIAVYETDHRTTRRGREQDSDTVRS